MPPRNDPSNYPASRQRTGQSPRAGDGDRTHDNHVGNVTDDRHQVSQEQQVRKPDSGGRRKYAGNLPQSNEFDDDLSTVVEHWASLPEALRTGILTMVRGAVAEL